MAIVATRIFRKVRALLTSSAVYIKRNSVGKMKAMAPQFFFLLKKKAYIDTANQGNRVGLHKSRD